VATLSNLIDRVRLELGDIGKSFVMQFVADGTTNRFRLHYAPLDGTGVVVFKDGIEISNDCSVEESTGVMVTDTLPADGSEFTVSGQYFRYFTTPEMQQMVETALLQHSAMRTDSVGRSITIDNLPALEEYPVVIYATTLALYTLATDAAFDIDIQAPDGVTIPRTERYRQLMQMVETRQAQYKELCTLLGVGMYSIDVFTFRRISKTTGHYVPVYRPQEVDDKSFPQRVNIPLPVYGDKKPTWITEGGDKVAYQNHSYSTTVDFKESDIPGGSTGKSYVAKLLAQRGSTQVANNFTLSVTDHEDGTFTASMSLTKQQTSGLAQRTYWSLQALTDDTTEYDEIFGGNFFTERESQVLI